MTVADWWVRKLNTWLGRHMISWDGSWDLETLPSALFEPLKLKKGRNRLRSPSVKILVRTHCRSFFQVSRYRWKRELCIFFHICGRSKLPLVAFGCRCWRMRWRDMQANGSWRRWFPSTYLGKSEWRIATANLFVCVVKDVIPWT